ncbi:hypothetical protein LEMLEM_LOCUS3427, partial [Lemmus lemmus]
PLFSPPTAPSRTPCREARPVCNSGGARSRNKCLNRHRKVTTPSSWVEATGVFQLHHFLPLFPSETKQLWEIGLTFCAVEASI